MYSQTAPMPPRREPVISTSSIQKILDENVQLIHNIIMHQKAGNTGREVHDLQHLLHKNLIYLATIADEATSNGSQRPPSLNAGGPPPGYAPMGPPLEHQQGLASYPPHVTQMQPHSGQRGPPMQMPPGQSSMPPNYMPTGPHPQASMGGPPPMPPQGMPPQPGHDERAGYVLSRSGMPPHHQGSYGYPPLGQQPAQFHQGPPLQPPLDYGTHQLPPQQQQRFEGGGVPPPQHHPQQPPLPPPQHANSTNINALSPKAACPPPPTADAGMMAPPPTSTPGQAPQPPQDAPPLLQPAHSPPSQPQHTSVTTATANG